MIRCVAVDDEPLALVLLESYIEKTPFLQLVGSYTNAFEALKVLKSDHVDLLFLDIQMPEITGLEIATAIDTFKTKVIFTTAFDSYALEGFRVDAIDYQLKPISYPDFLRSVQKAQRLIESSYGNSTGGNLIVKSDFRFIKVDYNDILYLESQRDYVSIHLEDGTEIKTLSTLKGLESTISTPPFYRVHRSFIVNITKVKALERNNIVFGKRIVPVSEGYKDVIKNIVI